MFGALGERKPVNTRTLISEVLFETAWSKSIKVQLTDIGSSAIKTL